MKDRGNDKRLIIPKDKFEEEASEGLGKLNREEAQEDLRELKDRLERRMKKPWMIWLTAAAAVVIILIASAVYISIFRGNRIPGTRVALNREVIRDTVLIAMAEPIVRMDTIFIAMAEPITRTESPALFPVSAPMTDRVTERSAVSMAAAEPVPQGGIDEFYLWIEKNIRYPSDTAPRVRREVVMTFRVAADSTLYDLQAESSPGDSFTREAVRLLREGPKWIPATRDGRVVEDEVSVSIVFRQSKENGIQ